MAIYCVTYDLRAPGRDYNAVFSYLKQFAYCKGMESFWLIDSNLSASRIRDDLKALVDTNDKIFVGRLNGKWASFNYGCGDWLNDSKRRW
ncbi:hypothetical protein MA04_04131 [Alcanivorax balearicus MACL04]|uniref:Uncharacterized protein n=1 Tax=Alloalcanivorax balearicus MACL04 TaxID=1177182 RepID=A0ABT2R4X3_9GAMM|nr:hypothetical protein [Alloalcanivorax balearicus MACL04]